MRLSVYHQLGHNYNWNFQSLGQDGVGDGVILGPRYMPRVDVEELEPRDQDLAIFDPQFFLPATAKGKLASYPFYPTVVAGGFSTDEFAETDGDEQSSATLSARGCVDFQVRWAFPYVVIPTRYMEGLPHDFIEKQTTLFVEPFLSSLDRHAVHRPVLLQLILNDLMLKNASYRADLLNWVTGLDGVAGVYLILSISNRTKQIKDPELLYAALQFIKALSRNAMHVVVGYTNTEALLLSLADPQGVSVGCYENMRMFNIRTFQDDTEPKGRQPNPRLYISRLLQWVDYRYIPFIRDGLKEGETFFDDNRHQALMFEESFNWHWMKPELYKHGMLEFWKQLRYVGDVDAADRYIRVRAMIETAREWYARFAQPPAVTFDPDSDGSHLPLWLTVADHFAHDQGWV